MGDEYQLVGENVWSREASPYLTCKYEVRNVGKFDNIEKMVEVLPDLIDEFANKGYYRIVEKESRENVCGESYHWNLLPPENFRNYVEVKLRKIEPSLKGEGVVRGGACDEKRISIYDSGTIAINTMLWHEPSN